ncbi:DUF262 domain-containing protein [Azoarcus sp. KH32C]|uniref:GmrSD restriction endonuclease domain-containing protein n=1 Tax=Azoarcus sp. KH32C TaxID=748247 RepID=UPI0002385E57|nr:DUF262 domain-containing protein [Azoarcus sp. KH32C]BAL22356.1 hypothetical protein AZKH_0004 [Azoarcus sp. KH32C]
MTKDKHDDFSQEILFADEEGKSAAEWTHLPPEREFFASPYDPPVKTLVAEIREKELMARPTFQRNAVWDRRRKSKFVESILLNIPIPNLFFAEDDDGTKVVVDGQQRLLALKDYVENSFPLNGLDVLHELNGRRFADLTERQQRIINNRTLRCLVISAKSDSEIRFEVFERLNTGGLPLNAQEVRHCVFRGALNDLLHELAKHPSWLALLGKEEPDNRMNDCELILRFFAIRDALPNYSPPLKTLLNSYMKAHRNPSQQELTEMCNSFLAAVDAVSRAFPGHPFRRAQHNDKGGTEWDNSLNRAVFDVQMIVMEGANPNWIETHSTEIEAQFIELCVNDQRFSDCVSRATADKTRMEYRLFKWNESLKNLGAQLPYSARIPLAPTMEIGDAE